MNHTIQNLFTHPCSPLNPMLAEVRTSINNLSYLLVQRGLYFISCLLFAVIVPRLMGAEIFGQYVLVTSLAIWFVLASTMGFSQIIGRQVPHLAVREALEEVGQLFGNLMTLRLISGALGAAFYLALTLLCLWDLDPLILGIMAGTIFIRAVFNLLYYLFLGLNQAGRWGMEETVRRWIFLILIIPGFYLGGLKGALSGLLLAELAVLALGLWWARPHLSWAALRLNYSSLISFLGFGLIFFASDLTGAAFDSSGALMVRTVFKDYLEVGYFGLAYGVYLNLFVVFMTLNYAFVPLLGTLRARGEKEILQKWVDRLIKALAIGGVMAVFAVLLLGEDLVPLILGSAYQPVAANLAPLMLTLAAQALCGPGYVLALTFDRPRVALTAAAIRLALFWTLGPMLIARWGSSGGCLAVLAATILYAVYITWRMRRVVSYSLKNFALVAGLGGLFLPLVWLRSHWSHNLLIFAGFMVAYGLLLFMVKVISPEEIASVWRVLTLRGRANEGEVQGTGKN